MVGRNDAIKVVAKGTIEDKTSRRESKSQRFASQAGSEEAKVGKCGQNTGIGGVAAEELDCGDAVLIQRVVDVAGQIVADGGGWKSDAGRPLFDERVDVGEAVVARLLEVVDDLCRRDAVEGLRAGRPDGGETEQAGTGAPLVGEVDPEAGAGDAFDALARLECEQGWVADEECGVSAGEH